MKCGECLGARREYTPQRGRVTSTLASRTRCRGTPPITPELSVRLTGGPYAAAAARRALGALRDVVGPARLDDVCLLVSELVTNGVRHADADEGAVLELEVVRRANCVRVAVRDPGPGFTRAPGPQGGNENGGWGLYLVDQLAERWGVEKDAEANTVWFELALASGPSGGSVRAPRAPGASALVA